MRAAWLLLGLCLLAACSSRRADFPFIDPEGRSLPVRRQAGEPFFRLRRGAAPQAEGRAFYLRYRELSRPLLLRLWDEEGSLAAEAPLPAAGGTTLRRLVSLPPGSAPAAFSLHPPPGGTAAEIVILESGLCEAVRGYAAGAGERLLGTRIDGYGAGRGKLELRFGPPGEGPEQGPDWGLELSLEADPFPDPHPDPAIGAGPELELRFSAPPRSLAVKMELLPGLRSQSFYAGVLPFRPDALTITGPETALRVKAVEFFDLPVAEEPDAPPPLAADAEVMLRYDPGRWRNADFELFRWNRVPEVLVFDTASYEVQDRYFKRLAFFVEKKGFRGRLVSPQEVRHLHGYNAHDYRAEDLARFFSAAAGAEASLSDEEARLLRILLAAGIVRPAPAGPGAGFLPGRGAVLSLSRSSPPALRRHLLVHEALHGVFFASAAYRAACESIWGTLSGRERQFWGLFLDWVGYDIDDPLLVVNEFQAYVLQQPRGGLEAYFQVLTRDRLLRRYPEREAEIRALVEDTGAGLAGVYERLEQALRQAAGLRGGRVSGLSFPDSAEAPAPGD
jgi:hypothetical protein